MRVLRHQRQAIKKITRFIILFILFFLFFSGQTKQDEALDCYGRAANLFKMAKKWSQVISLNFGNYMHKTGLAYGWKQGCEGGRGRVNIGPPRQISKDLLIKMQ
jgi:hypothetical protein